MSGANSFVYMTHGVMSYKMCLANVTFVWYQNLKVQQWINYSKHLCMHICLNVINVCEKLFAECRIFEYTPSALTQSRNAAVQ
jgi:hypothetical protein